jgi:hypothetical protein
MPLLGSRNSGLASSRLPLWHHDEHLRGAPAALLSAASKAPRRAPPGPVVRKPTIASDHVEERHGVSRPLGRAALLDLADRGTCGLRLESRWPSTRVAVWADRQGWRSDRLRRERAALTCMPCTAPRSKAAAAMATARLLPPFPSRTTEIGSTSASGNRLPPLPMHAWSAGPPRALPPPGGRAPSRQSRDRWSCSMAQCARKFVVFDRDDLVRHMLVVACGVSPFW